MPDDICGYEGTDGEEPCQNPTTDDGDPNRCWIPSHNPSKDGGDPQGRPPTVADHIDEIVQLAELPVSDRGVIRLSPIGWSTHKEWQNKEGEPYATYRERWDKHRGKAERKLAEEVAQNDPRFLLERAFGYTKEQTIEHEGDAANVTVDFGDVDP